MNRSPTGFIATCQCGVVVGALDYGRTDRKESGKLLGAWLNDGCTVSPQFESSWSCQIKPCKCEANQ